MNDRFEFFGGGASGDGKGGNGMLLISHPTCLACPKRIGAVVKAKDRSTAKGDI